MVNESKKRGKTSSTSSAAVASPIKLSKEDVFNVSFGAVFLSGF